MVYRESARLLRETLTWKQNKTKRKKKKKETWTCIGASVNRACESWDKIRVNYFASWSLYCQRIIARTLRVSSLALTLGVSSLAHLGRIIEMRLFFFLCRPPGLRRNSAGAPGGCPARIVQGCHCLVASLLLSLSVQSRTHSLSKISNFILSFTYKKKKKMEIFLLQAFQASRDLTPPRFLCIYDY